MLTNSILP